MKKLVNLNYIFSNLFVNLLSQYDLKNVCISPGSRSTSLTTAFAENKKINKYVIVDERSSAYFALGLAKQTGLPTAIVTTSGTAAANLYPAIIEAYQQRIPLIVCTTDRPEYLRNTGANQTINQVDLYKNHIRFFEDISLPAVSINHFEKLKKIVNKSLLISTQLDRGPVHLNFQFEKPLEKSITNLKVDSTFLEKLKKIQSPSRPLSSSKEKFTNINTVLTKINSSQKGLIIVGCDNYKKDFIKKLIRLSEKTKYPILADGASGIYLKSNHKNIMVNHQAFLRSNRIIKEHSPELILQLGNSPTSSAMLDFIKSVNAYKISINEFGDRKDSGSKFNKIIKAEPSNFCKFISDAIESKVGSDFLHKYQWFDKKTELIKNEFLNSTKLSDEINIINHVINLLPKNANLFVSNSLPIRDLEFFKSKYSKNINLFTNRGTSGIDGINTTAAGIAASSKNPTILITGDLSFYHDSNGLHNLMKYNIPLTIILINNGGGAIFGMLPIGKEKNIFDDYFFTPLNIDFSKLVKVYNGNYTLVKTYNQLQTVLEKSINSKGFSVLEIKTKYQKGIELRKNYFKEVVSSLEDEL
ncbi:MAG TPA: 2-succinyl-5-enolpyruvyl-6-hydroxy-3-cyclohexene-1-carboxylic-acid synthase [Ignavibacteria bacterium]|nr:2-succinyl-5-enolpyruvyl-6-hydroxy-3-cyclohexene-1-carboxylic-acid synthase [Ignavibacteria bacterium]